MALPIYLSNTEHERTVGRVPCRDLGHCTGRAWRAAAWCGMGRGTGRWVWTRGRHPRKMPYKLSATRKANVRSRLRMVEDNMRALNACGIHIKQLVRSGGGARQQLMHARAR